MLIGIARSTLYHWLREIDQPLSMQMEVAISMQED